MLQITGLQFLVQIIQAVSVCLVVASLLLAVVILIVMVITVVVLNIQVALVVLVILVMVIALPVLVVLIVLTALTMLIVQVRFVVLTVIIFMMVVGTGLFKVIYFLQANRIWEPVAIVGGVLTLVITMVMDQTLPVCPISIRKPILLI